MCAEPARDHIHIYTKSAQFQMLEQDVCLYETDYDIGSGKSLKYRCERTRRDGDYCELHSHNLWQSNPNLVVDALKEEMVRSHNSNKHMRLIGFHLPDIDLSNHCFNKQVYFNNTVFHKQARFTNSTFEKEVSFNRCVFEQQTSFEHVRFDKTADFFHINSAQILSFSHARFFDLAQLSACIIQESVFLYTHFARVQIRESVFKKHANFEHASFDEHFELHRSSFQRTSFQNAKFTTASFSDVKFQNKTNFRQVTFESPQDVHFDSDLTHVSFLGTDLSRVRFGSNTVWDKSSNSIPYDVRKLKTNLKKTSLADTLSVLRDLRDNYELRLDYEWAGNLFVQEMEIKRMYQNTNNDVKIRPWYWRWLSLTAWYGHLCTYGESLKRPVVGMLLVFVGFVLFFYIGENCMNAGTCKLESEQLIDAVTRTLSGLFQWSGHTLPDYVLRAISIPILGTIFVVLRRRFERRFRH